MTAVTGNGDVKEAGTGITSIKITLPYDKKLRNVFSSATVPARVLS